jgi:hypothetical protein
VKFYVAYVDEAGDEGFGKLSSNQPSGQSTWLILGAIVVSAENDKKLPGWRREIRDRFPEKKSPDLHWRNLNHDQRIVVVDDIAKLPLGISLSLSHKVTIPGSDKEEQFKKPQFLYNYLVRWLLERLVEVCERAAAPDTARLKVVFSRRRGTNYQTMREYLTMLAEGRNIVKAPRITNWDVLDIQSIEVENHSKRAGLQIADCTTSAFFTALEPNRFGNLEPSYAYRLGPRLIKRDKSANNSGLTIVPGLHRANCNREQLEILRRLWSGQAPGS